METSCVILPVSEKDVSVLAELDALCHSSFWTELMFSKEIASPHFLGFSVVEKDEVIGFVVGQALEDWADLRQIAVRPDRRKNGIGSALLKRFCDEAGKRGARKIFLEFREGNESARRLYEKCGFKIVGQRKNYYPPAGGETQASHALLMTCEI